ncbi:dihydrofolate reductase family protein [Microbacterium sp. HD4P20]|uniref:dihydrofolate reductase family protein n=1 Tax=Microbacterium sp. HD4P20 TaxID=2864874 RepID=UPI001C643C46|nr:dihydrofolate reductase family protein [Microbacterium sp. HD4P20]MCP2635398.1 dihydrofolate reductase family protein [Microbacterium sp. HD4P20]
MSILVADISISLDGYVAAAGRTPDEPMGPGGERLHEWMGSDEGQNLLGQYIGGLGAVITGRRTFDDSLPWWGADGPTGPARRPVIVITHEAPPAAPEGGVYQFVTTGIVEALDQARMAAAGDVVCVMGGADVIRQYLNAGLVDEISLHVAPVLLGAGTALFDGAPERQLPLERLSVVDTATALHVRYRVNR